MNFCKKLLCVAMSMVFVTASMCGCGSQGVASSGGNASQAEGPVELSAMVMQSRNYTGLQKMVAKLAEDENITIDFQVIPDDQFDNILKMKVNSGEAPDIIAKTTKFIEGGKTGPTVAVAAVIAQENSSS